MDKSNLKTLALVLPDGITLRNFVFSSFLEKATKDFRVVVFHFVDAVVFDDLSDDLRSALTFYKMETYREAPLAKVFRYAKQRASLLLNNQAQPNPTFLRNYPKYKTYPLKEQLPFLAANALASRPTQKKVVRLEQLHNHFVDRGNAKEVRHYTDILQREAVDVVFNVHQRDVKALPIVRAAKDLGIPAVNFVYSWDNLPKGRMAVQPDYYFTWSAHMKSEMAKYYPDIDSNRVVVTGTPQFEFYHTYPVTPRHVFAQKYQLDPNKRWVLYSGDMTDASPFDQLYLADTVKAFHQAQAGMTTELLFRRAPTDLTGRFAEVLRRYPEIKVIEPLWRLTSNHEMSLAVSREDVQLLVDLIHHCDTAVNFGSTMALDFAQVGKPIGYLNYNHPQIDQRIWSKEIFYGYTHFESIEGLTPVFWINSPSDLVKVFDPSQNWAPLAHDLQLWKEKMAPNSAKATQLIIEKLKKILLNQRF